MNAVLLVDACDAQAFGGKAVQLGARRPCGGAVLPPSAAARMHQLSSEHRCGLRPLHERTLYP
jgi:hypothetical protein